WAQAAAASEHNNPSFKNPVLKIIRVSPVGSVAPIQLFPIAPQPPDYAASRGWALRPGLGSCRFHLVPEKPRPRPDRVGFQRFFRECGWLPHAACPGGRGDPTSSRHRRRRPSRCAPIAALLL